MMVIRKQLIVEAPAERAYRVFSENMGLWWPREHHIGGSPLKDCIVEPRVNGRWYELCEDGSQCDWGKVLTWDPPRRLVLAWQLNSEFKYDPGLVTEVEVSFTSLGPTVLPLSRFSTGNAATVGVTIRSKRAKAACNAS